MVESRCLFKAHSQHIHHNTMIKVKRIDFSEESGSDDIEGVHVEWRHCDGSIDRVVDNARLRILVPAYKALERGEHVPFAIIILAEDPNDNKRVLEIGFVFKASALDYFTAEIELVREIAKAIRAFASITLVFNGYSLGDVQQVVSFLEIENLAAASVYDFGIRRSLVETVEISQDQSSLLVSEIGSHVRTLSEVDHEKHSERVQDFFFRCKHGTIKIDDDSDEGVN